MLVDDKSSQELSGPKLMGFHSLDDKYILIPVTLDASEREWVLAVLQCTAGTYRRLKSYNDILNSAVLILDLPTFANAAAAVSHDVEASVSEYSADRYVSPYYSNCLFYPSESRRLVSVSMTPGESDEEEVTSHHFVFPTSTIYSRLPHTKTHDGRPDRIPFEQWGSEARRVETRSTQHVSLSHFRCGTLRRDPDGPGSILRLYEFGMPAELRRDRAAAAAMPGPRNMRLWLAPETLDHPAFVPSDVKMSLPYLVHEHHLDVDLEIEDGVAADPQLCLGEHGVTLIRRGTGGASSS